MILFYCYWNSYLSFIHYWDAIPRHNFAADNFILRTSCFHASTIPACPSRVCVFPNINVDSTSPAWGFRRRESAHVLMTDRCMTEQLYWNVAASQALLERGRAKQNGCACLFVCPCVWMAIWRSACVCFCVSICVYICVYVCLPACICVPV